MKTMRLGAIMMLAVFGIAACNTVEGVGADVSATGQVISETATDVQNDLN